MPIFDYRCKECNTIYEILHKGKETAEDIQCPKCGSHIHTKLISAPSIIIKGPASSGCEQGVCGTNSSCAGGCGLN